MCVPLCDDNGRCRIPSWSVGRPRSADREAAATFEQTVASVSLLLAGRVTIDENHVSSTTLRSCKIEISWSKRNNRDQVTRTTGYIWADICISVLVGWVTDLRTMDECNVSSRLCTRLCVCCVNRCWWVQGKTPTIRDQLIKGGTIEISWQERPHLSRQLAAFGFVRTVDKWSSVLSQSRVYNVCIIQGRSADQDARGPLALWTTS